MDPTNNVPNNPMPNPVTPNPGVPPMTQTPATPVVSPVAQGADVAAPTVPINPVANPMMRPNPVDPTSRVISINSTPNQAAQTASQSLGQATTPASGQATAPFQTATPVNPIYRPNGGLVSATDPITMPNPPKAPDPIEEELKAPLKAADPVPGSIGSAISMPSDESTEMLEDIAMNDATMQDMSNTPTTDATAKPAPAKAKTKKKTSKTTWVLLAVVAAMVVIALAAVLVMQLI